MTVSEVAELLGYSTSMVHKLVNQNQLHIIPTKDPGIRARRTIRFDRHDIEKYIEEKKTEKQQKD